MRFLETFDQLQSISFTLNCKCSTTQQDCQLQNTNTPTNVPIGSLNSAAVHNAALVTSSQAETPGPPSRDTRSPNVSGGQHQQQNPSPRMASNTTASENQVAPVCTAQPM
ncbi:unnamed protein product [Orchesella dallaii]|uniref:Uncharacterized protein n=1 Tax=Orchesella dallaii TaxID=48710 RepID=A0ABP1Q497_9HEXA